MLFHLLIFGFIDINLWNAVYILLYHCYRGQHVNKGKSSSKKLYLKSWLNQIIETISELIQRTMQGWKMNKVLYDCILHIL